YTTLFRSPGPATGERRPAALSRFAGERQRIVRHRGRAALARAYGQPGSVRGVAATSGETTVSVPRRTLGVALVIALGACLDTVPTGPMSIHLAVHEQNVGSNDRAMLLELAGSDSSATISGVVAHPGGVYHVFAQLRSSTKSRVIVTGPIANGVVVELVVRKTATATLSGGTILDAGAASFPQVLPVPRPLVRTPSVP